MKDIMTGLLVFLWAAIGINAQGYDVTWGPEFKYERGLFPGYEFIDIQDNSYWVLQETDDETTIVEYDHNHRMVSVRSLGFRTGYDQLILQGIVRTPDAPYLLFHNFDFNRMVWRMLVSRFDNGKFEDPVVIYEEKQKINKGDFRRLKEWFENGFADPPVMSEDSSRIAFINILPGEDYKEDEYITAAVFDESFQLQWHTWHKYKFSRKDFEITQRSVSEFGRVYLVGWTHKERSGDKRGDRSIAYLPEFEYKLYEIRKEEIVQDIVNIGRDVAALDVALFFPDPQDEAFLLTGFYTDDSHKTRQKGLFFATGHPDAGLLSSKLSEFEPRFLSRLLSEKDIEKGKGLDMSFNINELIRFDNGTMGFVAEKNYVSYTSNNDFYHPYYGYNYYRYNSFYGTGRRQPVYHTHEIIIPVFDADGKILNIEVIDKAYNSSSTENISYVYAQSGAEVILIFNDRKSRDERKATGRKGSRFTDIVIIDASGRVKSRETLFTNRELDLDLVTDRSVYKDGMLLLGSESGNKYTFGLLRTAI